MARTGVNPSLSHSRMTDASQGRETLIREKRTLTEGQSSVEAAAYGVAKIE